MGGLNLPVEARRRRTHGCRNKNRRTLLLRQSDGGSALKPGPLWPLIRDPACRIGPVVAQFCAQVRKIAIRITMTAITPAAIFVTVKNERYVCS